MGEACPKVSRNARFVYREKGTGRLCLAQSGQLHPQLWARHFTLGILGVVHAEQDPRDDSVEGRHKMTAVRHRPETEALLTPSEVATLFRVDPKTVTRWAKAGKLTSIRTLGGHRRYRESEVRSLLDGNTATVEG